MNSKICSHQTLIIIYTMSEADQDIRVKKAEEDQEEEISNPFDSGLEDEQEQPLQRLKKSKKERSEKKEKREKREKKEKKEKKRRWEEEEEEEDEDDDEGGMGGLFDDQAESGEEDSEVSGDEMYDEDEKRRYAQVLNKKRATQNFLSKFRGKDDKQINAQYSRQLHKRREAEEMYPGDKDPKLYVIGVRPRHEEQMVLKILNKARHLAGTSGKVTIVSALAMRKKFPGKIFIEAFSPKDITDSLDGFTHVSLARNLTELDSESYVDLFSEKNESHHNFQEHSFVRIRKGLYDGDIAKIYKVKSSSVDVLIVPRINVQDIVMKIRQQTSQIASEEERAKKQEELLKLFIDHKTNNYRNRPAKDLLTEESFEELKNLPGAKNIKLTYKNGSNTGLIMLTYRLDEIEKNLGTYLPVEVLPFTSEGNFIDEIREDRKNFSIGVNFKKGEEAEIVAGELMGHYGVVVDIQDNVGVLKCKNKDPDINGQMLYEPLEHLSKRFKERQRVKVSAGADAGKTGIILKVEPKMVEVWTDNENSIRVNKKNLELHRGEAICQQNVHSLKKDDLVRTSKGLVGIVLETRKDSMKLLDINNSIQVVSNMDFDSLLPTRNLIAKNRTGDEINANSIVIIRQGAHEGKRCKVIHVYRQHVFLFNQSFDRTAGISVETADNCSLVSKNDTFKRPNMKAPALTDDVQEELVVGKTIILKSGPLKGYQGVVKSINKDKIEVRVPSKSTTVTVERESVAAKQEGLESGKTPNRRGGATHIYSASPKF